MAHNDAPLVRPVFGRLYIAQGFRGLVDEMNKRFRVPEACSYLAYCDDFGPMNIASVFRFNSALKRELQNCGPSQTLFMKVDQGRRALSNAVFLLGAFMILEQKKPMYEIMASFSWLNSNSIEAFRDATYAPVDFELSIADCWRGLMRGVQIGWIRSPTEDDQSTGLLDMQVYEHFDNPLNGDLHTVVPGKLVAFAGPLDHLEEGQYLDDVSGHLRFSPKYFANAFVTLGVTDIVQLNFNPYDASPFVSKGIKVHPLPFEDCTCPPEDLVEAFLRIVDNARGLVAVHCRAGLGRTGTLIARYLMRTHGFPARHAIGWLRILRPGMVIGPQQHYLCTLDPSAAADAPRSVRSENDADLHRARRLRVPQRRCPSAGSVGADRPGPAVRVKRWIFSFFGFPPRVASAPPGGGSGGSGVFARAGSEPSRAQPLRGAAPPPAGAYPAGPGPHRAVSSPPALLVATAPYPSPLAAQVRLGMEARAAARVAAARVAGGCAHTRGGREAVDVAG